MSFNERTGPLTVEEVKKECKEIHSYFGNYGIYEANDPYDIMDILGFQKRLLAMDPIEAADFMKELMKSKYKHIDNYFAGHYPLDFREDLGYDFYENEDKARASQEFKDFEKWIQEYEKVLGIEIEY